MPNAIAKLLVLSLVVPLLASCSMAAPPVKGTVMEEGTGRPVEGAIVVVRWVHYGSAGLVDSRTSCRHVETATTDAQGRFEVPGRSTFSLFGETVHYFTPYKAGYEEVPLAAARPKSAEENIVMRPFRGTRGERMDQLSRFTGMQCGHWENYSRSLLPLYRLVVAEAMSVATTIEEKRAAVSLQRELEEMELGQDEAWRNWRKRLEELR